MEDFSIKAPFTFISAFSLAFCKFIWLFTIAVCLLTTNNLLIRRFNYRAIPVIYTIVMSVLLVPFILFTTGTLCSIRVPDLYAKFNAIEII